VAIGVALPFSPLADTLGFKALPAGFLALLVAMIGVYLVLIELGKRRFYRLSAAGPALSRRRSERERHVHHRASRFSSLRPPAG
jgi:P-type Mg2+ transporter